jgi:preprotein translocase subunit YajC
MQDLNLQIFSGLPWVTLVLVIVCGFCLIAIYRLSRHTKAQAKLVNQLQQEIKVINSGHLGMGRRVRDVSQYLANFNMKQNQLDSVDEKTYQQAGILLSRGASVDEVVDSFQITPAEAELLSIIRQQSMTNSQSSSKHQSNLSELSIDSEVA